MAFSLCVVRQNDRHVRLIQTRLECIKCSWYNFRKEEAFVWALCLSQSVAIFVPRLTKIKGKCHHLEELNERMTRKNGSDGIAASLRILLEVMVEMNKPSLDAIHCPNLLISNFTTKSVKNWAKTVFSPSSSCWNDNNARIFQTRLQWINCSWCNYKEEQVLVGAISLFQSVAIKLHQLGKNSVFSH